MSVTYTVAEACPKCFRKAAGDKCVCGFNLFLFREVEKSKEYAEQKVRNSMLYNLTIALGDYGSKPLFTATALTYEQCDAQISKVRQYQKEISGDSSDQKKLKITMTPVSFTVFEKE